MRIEHHAPLLEWDGLLNRLLWNPMTDPESEEDGCKDDDDMEDDETGPTQKISTMATRAQTAKIWTVIMIGKAQSHPRR